MKPIERDEILDAERYEASRDEIRRRMMVLKDRRRAALGDYCTAQFENRETLRYQIHEMLRAEKGFGKPDAVDDELAAYNPLVPATGELSATVMFEYETPELRAEWLTKLVGIENHLWLVIGTETPIPARFDRMQIADGKISSVQFVKWRVDERRRELLKDPGTVVKLLLDHPAYQAVSVLSEQTRREIMSDAD